MGITIYYKGQLKSKDKATDVIDICEEYSKMKKWNYKKEDARVLIFPDGNCEPIIIEIDQQGILKKGSTKTQFTSIENHDDILGLFVHIKKYFSSLDIEDESGGWYDYLNRHDNFPDYTSITIYNIKKKRYKHENGTKSSEDWFWKTDIQKSTYLNFYEFRDWIADDLEQEFGMPINLKLLIEKMPFDYPRIDEIKSMELHSSMIVLLSAWIMFVVEKNCNKNKVLIYSWSLAVFYEWFWGGYYGNKHKKAIECIDRIIKNYNVGSKIEETMKIAFLLMKYLNIGKNYYSQYVVDKENNNRD